MTIQWETVVAIAGFATMIIMWQRERCARLEESAEKERTKQAEMIDRAIENLSNKTTNARLDAIEVDQKELADKFDSLNQNVINFLKDFIHPR